jgi:hypothetical protein
MFFNTIIALVAEVNIYILLECLAALVTIPMMIAIVVVLFRLLVVVIVLLITGTRKIRKKLNKSHKSVEEASQGAIEPSANASKARFKKKAPGIVGAGGSGFREGSSQGSTAYFRPTCYDRQEEMAKCHA